MSSVWKIWNPRAIKIILLVVLLVGLPILGVALAGKPVAQYLEFPPLTRYVEHAPFSWGVFALLGFGLGVILAPALFALLGADKPQHVYVLQPKVFPWWGWLGLGVTGVAWTLAWTRFSWFSLFQLYTFTPLWLGYIVTVNAWTFQRTGHCLMRDRPGYFLGLFPLSALFWWFFEYLNRFVQNWYYLGGADITAQEYVLHATHSFSTVLPAVLSTIQWLESFPDVDRAFRDWKSINLPTERWPGWLVLALAGGGLMGIGVWPDYLFPLLWVSPLLIITGLQVVFGEDTIFSSLRNGDWRPVWLSALAGLICGFFWEMWNSRSLAHWEYAVPYVHGYQIFEMPFLGYAGYVPFGLECVVVARLLSGRIASDSTSR